MDSPVRLRRGLARADWLEHPDVGAAEFAVLCALSLFADERGVCWPSQGLMARMLKKSRAWVSDIIARLDELGLVEVAHRRREDGGMRSCLYTLKGHNVCPLPVGKVQTQAEVASGPTQAPASIPASACQASGTACQPADTEHESNEENPDSLAAGAAPESIVSLEEARKGRAEPVVPPEDWQPSDAALCWALDRFPEADLLGSVEAFVLKSRAKGYRYADLEAGWKIWLKQDMDVAEGKGVPVGFAARTGRGPAVSPNQTRFAVWAAVAHGHAPRAA